MMLFEEDYLKCPDCGRKIRGITGLDELMNISAHMAEHHDVTLDTWQALELRAKWEEDGARSSPSEG